MSGLTDKKVAELTGVSRETINTWKNHNSEFKAELNKQRNSLLQEIRDRRLSIVSKSYDVIDKYLDMQLENNDIEIKYAIDIIKLYNIESPTLETDPKAIENKEKRRKELFDFI